MIAIEPGELDRAAKVCAGDSLEALQGYLGVLGAADAVDLPPEVAGRVTAAVDAAARSLLAIADELDALGQLLREKAAQARMLDGDLGALLAMDLAPILRFTNGEDHWLDDPMFFLRHSAPVEGGYRDLDDQFHTGDNDRAKNLYQWDSIERKLTFWFFYAYNDGTNNHEGDWERVTIEFGQDGTPDQMHFSNHDGSRTLSWDEVEKDVRTGQPQVYVSKGSHAVVPHASNWATGAKLPVVDIEVPKTPLTDDDAHGDGPRLDLATKPPVDVERQPWYPSSGDGLHWGDNHLMPDEFPVIGVDVPFSGELNGPTGPSPEKGHLTG